MAITQIYSSTQHVKGGTKANEYFTSNDAALKNGKEHDDLSVVAMR